MVASSMEYQNQQFQNMFKEKRFLETIINMRDLLRNIMYTGPIS